MNPGDLEPTIRQSVVDRLIDTAPRHSADPPPTWSQSVRQKREALMRDLEWLLNTRRILHPAPADMPELQASVYNYGLPDITSMSRDSADTRQYLLRRIEEAVELFEPRLMSVRVSAVEGAPGAEHSIRFVIEALLRMEPDPERVMFDTVLEVSSGEFHVSGEGYA